MTLYFAYGSNMDAAQMKERCPNAELLGPAVLKNYELAFTIYSQKRKCGCADVVPKDGALVYGLLYRLTDEDQERMNAHEGHPIHYQRVTVTVTHSGEDQEAVTYEVVNKQEPIPTSNEYLDLLRNAAKLHAFPEDYQAMLAAFVPKEIL